jgi:hypothetical protein
VHHEAVIAVAVAPAAVVATGMRAEDEAGEEDDGDDEDDAGHDADPGSHRSEPAVAVRLCDYGSDRRGFGGGQRTGCRFGGRRCFTHETHDASGADVPALNSI